MRDLFVNNYVIKASIVEILQKLKLVLTNGKLRDIREGTENIVVTCPDHSGGQETKPACNIYVGPDSKIPFGYFNCFVCGSNGNFLKFVSHCFDSTEKYALSWLLKNFEHEQTTRKIFIGEPIDLDKKKRKPVILDESLLDKYQTWTPYLAKRKLSRGVCAEFKVRYDPIYRQVIFPAYDIKGNLVMMPKRSIDTKSFYLDKELEKPVYCLDYIMKHNYRAALITEGPFDTLTGWEYGYPTCGTFGQPSPYQIEQINKSCISVLYTAFDNDDAGQKFTRALKRGLDKRIIVVELKLPKGKKDLNDLSKEELDKIIQEASIS